MRTPGAADGPPLIKERPWNAPPRRECAVRQDARPTTPLAPMRPPAPPRGPGVDEDARSRGQPSSPAWRGGPWTRHRAGGTPPIRMPVAKAAGAGEAASAAPRTWRRCGCQEPWTALPPAGRGHRTLRPAGSTPPSRFPAAKAAGACNAARATTGPGTDEDAGGSEGPSPGQGKDVTTPTHGEFDVPAVADDSASLAADVVDGPPPSRRGHHRPDARGSDALAVATAAASLAAGVIGVLSPSGRGHPPPSSRRESNWSCRRRRSPFARG